MLTQWKLTPLVLAAALTFGACKDTKTEPEPEPEVATMRLTIGTTNPQTVNVSASGVVTGGPISIKQNVATAISAAWLKADGSVDAIATSADFRLEVASLTPATITFTRSGDFTGTLTGTATTTAGSGQFSLFHKAEQHSDFGPFPVTISVVP